MYHNSRMDNSTFCVLLFCYIDRCIRLIATNKHLSHNDLHVFYWTYHTGVGAIQLVRPIVDDDAAFDLLVATETAKYHNVAPLFHEARKLLRMFKTLADDQLNLALEFYKCCRSEERSNPTVQKIMENCDWDALHLRVSMYFYNVAYSIGFDTITLIKAKGYDTIHNLRTRSCW